MSLWTAIVAIVALICIAEIIKSRHRTDAGITTDMMGNEKPIAPPTNPVPAPRGITETPACCAD